MPAIYVPEGSDSVANTTTADQQIASAVTWLADGLHYVVAWTSYEGVTNTFEVRARIFNADGTATGADFLVATGPTGQSDAHVAALSGGGFVVIWNDSTVGTGGIWGQVYDATLTGGTPTLLKSGLSAIVSEPSVSGLPSGDGFVLTWTEDGGSDPNVHAQVFTSAGIASGPEVTANPDLTGAQFESAVAALSSGNYVVVWQDGNGAEAPEIRMAIYTQAGVLVPGSGAQVNSTTLSTQEVPTVTALTGGGYVVAWTDWSETGNDTDGPAIRAQIFDSAGATVGFEFLVNDLAAGAQTQVQIAALADGGFLVSWTSRDGADDDIRAQRFDAGGNKLGDAFLIPSDPDGDQAESAVSVSPNGDLVVTWTDYGTLASPSLGDIEQRLFDLHSYPTVDLNGAGSGLDFATTHIEGGAGTPIADATLVVTQDSEHPIVTITITITDAVAGDQLTLAGALPAGITSSAPGGTTLTLTNSGASADDLEQALLLVRYSTTSDNPTAGAGNADRVISIVANDGTLSSDPAGTTVAITATNDPAVLSADTRNLTETNLAADISSSGTLTISDVDSPATFVAQGGTAGTYGTFAIDSAGAWTYTASSAHNEFADGVTYTDTFPVASADGTMTSVTINILGTNDAAVLSADVRNLTETNLAADISSSGTLTASDVDSSATFVAQGGTVGTYGTFAIDAAGAWTYTASSAHNEFVDGVTYTDTFPVSSADGTTTSVTINILGTNDAAVLSADVRNLTETNLAADISSSGTLTISDVDSSATFVAQGGTVGTYGTLAIDTAGAWTYTASSAHNEFVDGVTYTDTFPVASADGTMTSVTINILGTNDAAILSADTRNLTETNLAADISSSGTLTISEVDSPATFVAQGGTAGTYGTFAIDTAGAWTYTASSAHNEFVDGVTYTDTFPVASADGTMTSVTINILGTNDAAILSADTRNLTETNLAADISSSGTLTVSDVDSPATFVAQGGTAGSYGTFAIDTAGAWTYTASSAHNEFVDGVTYTDTFSVSSADGTTTSVTINILGTNDAAVLSADVRDLTETNLAADISSSGTLTVSDVDSPATFVAQGGTVGTYGTFAIDAAGAWTYTASSAHNEFADGVTYTDTFPVASADGTMTSVTINILGTNDAAILSADTRNLTETNLAADISSSGTLTISDVDSPATFVAQGGTAGTYGTFAIDTAGAWTYTASSAHNEFVDGVTYTDTFLVSSADGTTTSVTINILGTNDAAVLSADVRNLTETNLAADISSSGTLTISDVNSPATFVAQGGTVGTYGTFAIDTAGAWTYTASSAHDEFVDGVTYTDTFSVAAADGTATSVTINILGTNDAAVLSADVRDLTETNLAADISSSGTLTISDVDSPATFVAQGGTVGTYGTFAIDTAGAWTYTASSAHDEFVDGVTYTDTFPVSSADGTTTSVTINILGTNDAAMLSADVRNLTETNLAADISSSGTLTASDVNSSATFVAQGGTAGTYGTFAIDTAGAWTYTASSAHNEFAVGVTYTDTFPVSSADGTMTSVTINILGTNDAAVLSADVRDLTETNLAADISSSGTLTISDVDSPATFVAQGGTAGTYGTFAIDSAGAWTYTASSAHDEFADGVTYTDTFPVSAADGTLTSVTINILGTNDAAVLSADIRDLTETNLAADISSSGTLTISDVDSPATFVAQGGTVGAHGTFAIDTAGAWTYTASSAHNEFAAGVTYTDTFSVASADGTLTSVTVNILGTNDAPEGVDHSLTFTEDVTHVFTAADFTYTDAENDDFFSVTIATLPALGTGIIYYDADGAGITFAPVAISAGQTFTAADLADGRLTYVPPTNVNGVASASFTYQVRDDAGTDDGGADFDASANTITINLTAVNDAPTVAIAPPGTTDEHIALSLKGAISVGDVDSASDTIQVDVSVGYGILTADPTGSGAIVSGSGTSAITITGTLAQVQAFLGSGGPSTLTYTPNTDNPPASTTLTVTVDDGGHNGTGGTLTATANQSINIVQINDAPSGFDHPITASENTPRALNPVDFAFTDPEGHGFAAVTIVTLPTQGTLMYDADGAGGPGAPVAVTAGTTFTAAQLVGAKLVYRADPDESGLGYATFTYIVRDNGGTDHGGLDTDPGANTITINVNAFNNGPTVTDLDNDSPTFFEDTLAGVVWLDEGRDAVVSDLDSADFNGGSLTVRIVVNKVVTEDELVLITGTNGVTMTGNEVFVDGISIGTYSGGGLGEDLVFTLNAGATPASITRLIHNLSYLNTDTVEPNTAQRLVEFRLLDGDGGSMSAYTTINVVSVDDPATAGADDATTDEATAVTIMVLANDDDIDGPPPSVAEVNGNPISVGTPITLPSGALLTLNADGTFTYDPNHAFDSTPTAGSGASNTPAQDEFSYTLAVAGGTATVSLTITGLDTNDTLLDFPGDDILIGGTGDDSYFVHNFHDRVIEASGGGYDIVYSAIDGFTLEAGSEVEVLGTIDNFATDPIDLTGNGFANFVTGNAGANTLDGGGGLDHLWGREGDDSYLVDSDDVVLEYAGQGYDIVYARTDYALTAGAAVEVLATIDNFATDAIDLTGNALANYVTGNAGGNTLDGGGGLDHLWGREGDDSYLVDDDDVVIEHAGQGYDIVYARTDYILTPGAAVEVLGTIDNLAITAINLTGNELDNYVTGNAGANALDGGGGSDYLWGREGDDSYFVDSNDVVLEYAGHGYDIVYARTSFTLGAGVAAEVLGTINNFSTTALNLTGNELANAIFGNAGANILGGGDGNDTLSGLEGDDTLLGGTGADSIYGGAGADSIDGGTGADAMVGGAGDDSYFVDNALDAIVEAASEGNDTVRASGSYTLAAGSEIETLSTISLAATTAIDLTGNGFDNILYGNAGANILNGGGGNDTLFGLGGTDTLIGGAGEDSFVFNTALGSGNIDTIAEFSALDDTIVLDHLVFVGLGLGPIEEGAFIIGTSANDDDDRIIYDPTTGALYYDADGGEGGAAVQFATLQGAPAIAFGDFTVI